jgi:hypothetical protein
VNKIPSGGIKSGWSPIMDHPNAWVSVGPENTCQTYSDINGAPPEWGLTGEGNPETFNIACCIDVEDDKSEATSEAENTVPEAPGLTEQEQAVLDAFKPVWNGRSEGYNGGTYDEAEAFCRNISGKTLCPSFGESIYAVSMLPYYCRLMD